MNVVTSWSRGQDSKPVVLFSYARPDFTKQALERILTYSPSRLYLVQDGCSDESRIEAWRETRAILDAVNYPEAVRMYANLNMGLRDRFFSALDAVFNQEEWAIILEDDTLPDETFFEFTSELLEKYREDNNLGIIGGTNFAPSPRSPDYFFSRASYIWGWATWARVWRGFRESNPPHSFTEKDIAELRGTYSNFLERLLFERLLRDLPRSKTWDVPFSAYLRRSGLLSVIPGKNLVINIGAGGSATNTRSGLLGAHNLLEKAPSPLSHPQSKEVNLNLERNMWLKRAVKFSAETLGIKKPN